MIYFLIHSRATGDQDSGIRFIVPLILPVSATGETKSRRKGGVSIRLSGLKPLLDLWWYRQMCPVGNFRAVWHVHCHIIIAMCPLGARVPFDDEPPTGISFMVARVCGIWSLEWCLHRSWYGPLFFTLYSATGGSSRYSNDNFNGMFVADGYKGIMDKQGFGFRWYNRCTNEIELTWILYLIFVIINLGQIS